MLTISGVVELELELQSEMEFWWGLVKVEAQSGLCRGSRSTTTQPHFTALNLIPNISTPPKSESIDPGIAIDHGL